MTRWLTTADLADLADRRGRRGLAVVLLACLAVEAALTLDWKMVHDIPLLHYVAFLVDRHDFVPYRDVLETSGVGTFLFHIAIGKTFGYGDLGVRVADLGLLAALLAVVFIGMRRAGTPLALVSAAGMGLLYLARGPAGVMQKDYVGAVPAVVAFFLCVSTRASARVWPRAAAVGALFGAAALVKPHLAVGLPILGLALITEDGHMRVRRVAAVGGAATAGFLLVCAPPFLWLWNDGALPSLVELYTAYLPLHLSLTGEHEVVSGTSRLLYLVRSYLLEMQMWAFPAIAGLYVAATNGSLSREGRRACLWLALLTLAYSLTPVLAGQFFDYHWIPFRLFATLCASLLLLPLAAELRTRSRERVLAAVFVAFLILFATPHHFIPQLFGASSRSARSERVAAITTFLQDARLAPEDRVQPLDWTGGAVHAMLRAEAVLATPFLYDYHFYHHVSHPIVQRYRQRFVAALEEHPPRFVIDMKAKPHPSGPDTTRDFPALERFLREHYRVALEGDRFEILERSEREAPRNTLE